jgi:hypothetical protein
MLSLFVLEKLLDSQIKLLNLAIFLIDKKSIEVEGECISIEYEHNDTSVLISLMLSAGGSIETIKAISSLSHLRFSDSLPIARAVVEGFINATYVLAVGKDAVDNAIAHAVAKSHKDLDKLSGKGAHKISVKQNREIIFGESVQKQIKDFTHKKGFIKNWTDLSVPQRIIKIDEAFGNLRAMELNGAYFMVYSDASEVIHCSYYGSLLSSGRTFFNNSPKNIEELTKAHEVHIESAYLSSILALSGFLYSFSKYFGFKTLQKKLDQNMEVLAELAKRDK